MIRTLFVDDEVDVLEGLENRLRRLRRRWSMSFAQGGQEALKKLALAPFDVVVSDIRMPGMDGAELLDRVRVAYPGVIRIALSGQTEYEQILRALPIAHHFLSKPCDAGELEASVERVAALKTRLADPGLRDALTSMDSLPSEPRLYAELTTAVERRHASAAEVGAIVERDVAMTARILQVVNSAFFGLGRAMTTAQEAASFLGLDAVRAIVLNAELFSTLPADRLGRGFSFESAQRHAVVTGRVAMRLLEDTDGGRVAFSAGVLHDVGELILASSFPDEYTAATQRAELEGGPRWKAETVGHAGVGAALLELWGVPHALVEGVAYHHDPAECPHDGFGVVGAVHVASALANEALGPVLAGEEAESIDLDYLARVGVDGKLDAWRSMVRQLVHADAGAPSCDRTGS